MRFTFTAVSLKKRVLLLLAVLLLAVLLIIVIGSAVKNRETPEFLTLEEISPSPDTPFGAACTEMLSEYQAVLSVTEDIWTLNAAEYAAQYPRVNHIYAGFFCSSASATVSAQRKSACMALTVKRSFRCP